MWLQRSARRPEAVSGSPTAVPTLGDFGGLAGHHAASNDRTFVLGDASKQLSDEHAGGVVTIDGWLRNGQHRGTSGG